MAEEKHSFHPSSEEEVEQVIAWALASQTPLVILGNGSRRDYGPLVNAETQLALGGLSGILSYEPEELVISALAGTPLSEIEAALEEKGQYLAFEPPGYGQGSGTLGGMVAAGFSGPRRMLAGGVRDHVLGVHGVTGRAERFKIGGRVVKNVTGYDLSKLLTGSFGTLAVMTQVTLKVLPMSEAARTLYLEKGGPSGSLAKLRAAAASPFSVTGAANGAATIPGHERRKGSFIRLEGREDEIEGRMKKLQQHLDVGGEVLPGAASQKLWQQLRNLEDWQGCDVIWRINLSRARADKLLDWAKTTKTRVLFDWAGARAWVEGDAGTTAEIQELVSAVGGKATLFKAPLAMKLKTATIPPIVPPLETLSNRIRDAFDPNRILNPVQTGDK